MDETLTRRVLQKLGLSAAPADLTGLQSVYRAWCRAVPFDNSRKLVHMAAADDSPLPGADPADYFEAWLRWGTGGTCWAGNGALCALLQSLGFDAVRGVATMMIAPNLPPNHGTVVVRTGGERYLVDASMLFEEPLLLKEEGETRIEHDAHGVRCSKRDGKWYVAWRPLHKPDGMECRIDELEATAEEFDVRHEHTRGWSPFNFEQNIRRNVGGGVLGIAFGHRVRIDPDGAVTREPIEDRTQRDRILIEELGVAEELVRRLPDDRKTPPPPAGMFTAPGADIRRPE